MKRILVAIPAFWLTFSICACDGPHFDEPESTPEIGSLREPGLPAKIV